MSATQTDTKAPTLKVAREHLKGYEKDAREASAVGASASQRIAIALARAEALANAVPGLKLDGAALLEKFGSWTADFLRSDEVSGYLTAGRVAVVILDSGAPLDAKVSKSALGDLNKVLAARGSDLPNGMSGADTVLAIWKAASDSHGRATIAGVQSARERIAPKVTGSRGPAKGSDSAQGNGRKPKAPAKPEASAPDSASKPEAGEQRVTDSRKSAAVTRLNRALSAFEKVVEGDSARRVAWTLMLQTLEACEVQGCAAVRLGLVDIEPKPEAAPKPKRTRRNGQKVS